MAFDQKAYLQAYYQANKERLKAAAARRRLEKPEECRAAVDRWHKDPANAEKRRTYFREVVAKRESFKAAQTRYREKNRAAINARTKERKLERHNRVPAWLTVDDKDCIKSIYKLASIYSEALGTKFHVDHIVPLRGRCVSGLHVPLNLQILPARENRKKHNLFAA